MPKAFKAACLQFTASSDAGTSIARALSMAREAAAAGAQFVALPEFFAGLSTDGARFRPVAFAEDAHPALPAFRGLAGELGLVVLLGSLAINRPDGRIANRSYLIDRQGQVAARYDKIHLFDVDLGPGRDYRESAIVAPGDRAIVAPTPWGGIGLSICYDLRFPQLYRALARGGASMLAVPAAFTRLTGEAHWHVLCRARAIENAAYVIAPCQSGTLAGGGECHGHSLIVDPWGRILADGGAGEGIAIAGIDPSDVVEARSRIPALRHDRQFSAPNPDRRSPARSASGGLSRSVSPARS